MECVGGRGESETPVAIFTNSTEGGRKEGMKGGREGV